MEKAELLKKIENLIVKKDYISARKLIRNDLKRIGSKYDYYFYFGIASTDVDERLKYFEKAFDIEPDNIDIIINLANVKDELGFYDEAINGYNRALGLDSKNALVYNNRGFSYFHKGDFEKALNDYNSALVLSPKLKIAQYNKEELIKILKKEEKYSDLLVKFDNNENDYKYFFNLGMQEANLGNYEEAIKFYDRSLKLNPDNATVYLFKGIVAFQQGEYEKAKGNYSFAIKLDANMVDAYFNRAQIVFVTKTKNKDELNLALEDLKKSVELDNNFIDAYYSMAVIYKNLSEYENSIKTLDKILEIDEQSVNARALKKLLIKKYLN